METALVEVTVGVKLRTRGFVPRLSDSEVITLGITGEALGHDGDGAMALFQAALSDVVFPGCGGSWHLRAASGESLADQAIVAWGTSRRAGGAPPMSHIIDGFSIASAGWCVRCATKF